MPKRGRKPQPAQDLEGLAFSFPRYA